MDERKQKFSCQRVGILVGTEPDENAILCLLLAQELTLFRPTAHRFIILLLPGSFRLDIVGAEILLQKGKGTRENKMCFTIMSRH